jgi:flagellar motor switch protein FliN
VADTALASPAALGNSPALAHFGANVATHAAESLGAALGQPVRFGAVQVRPAAPGEPESENLDLFHPVDILWETAGTVFATLLLLPKLELQSVLPSARGSADLPDMEALGSVLRDLAEHISGRLMNLVPIHFSLADGAGHVNDPNQPQMRLEHTASVGQSGAETHLTVIHLVPAAALEAVVARLAESGAGTAPAEDQALESPPYAAAAADTSTQAHPMEEPMAAGQASQAAGTSVHPVQFQPFDGDVDVTGNTNLDLLLDVSLRVAVELGRTDLTIKDVLALGPGSVVELDKLAGEPVDILVNDRLIAKGEVVVVDENFGVRVTDIVSPQKRIGKLR